MSTDGSDGPDGSGGYIGVIAAAKLLGVHRSTLSLAIQRRDIIPDAYTPGGHPRFTLDTIEAYRAQVREAPVASGARTRLTQLLARMLAEATEPRELAELALRHLAKMIPSLAQAMVLVHKPTLDHPWHVELLAGHGVNWQEALRMGALRGTHEFAYLRVLREGTAIENHDTRTERMPSGTHVYVEQTHLGAFELLPLTVGKQILGVFELGFKEARRFTLAEVQFYSHIADLLALAIWQSRQQTQYHDYLMAAGDMVTKALERRVAPMATGAARMEQFTAMLTGLAESYRTLTGAFTVICTAGPPAPGMIQDETVRELADRCVSERRDLRKRWPLEGRPATAVATSVPLPGGQAVGIAAGWKLPRAAWDEDLYLLQVLAGACVLGLSPA